jgi:hypothetical protein
VFDPGLGSHPGRLFGQSFTIGAFSNGKPDATLPENARMGSIFAQRAKTNSARKIPRRVRDL